MIRNATMPADIDEPAGTQVFVDSTGRRKRFLAVAGFFAALFSALYIGLIGTSVVRASDAVLTTKASVVVTVTTAVSASASASPSAS